MSSSSRKKRRRQGRRDAAQARPAERQRTQPAAAASPAPGWRPSIRLLTWLALAGLLAGGAWLRLDNLETWRANEQRFFHDGQPLLMSIDGFYYLTLSRSLLAGEYAPVDALRGVPHGVERPSPPPLLAVITAGIVRVTGASLDWVGVVLPPLLAVLLALPLYGLGREYGGRGMGIVAAAVAVGSPFYVDRTVAGWYDTDCLNLTFAMALPYFWLRFAETDGRARWLHGAAAVATWLLYLWWWDYGRTPATLAFAAPLGAMLLLQVVRHQPRERWWRIALPVLVVVAVVVWSTDLWERMLGTARYVSKAQVGAFPASGTNVVEQTPGDLARIVAGAAGSSWAAVVAGIGLALLAWRQRLRFLFLAFPLAVSLLSFQAIRFILFFCPLVALGIGSAAHELWTLRRQPWGRVGAALLLAGVAWPLASDPGRDNRLSPRRFPWQVEGMKAMAEHTPPDAVIWTDWGHGYPIQYYGRRGTLADGGHRSDEMLYALGVPLATSDFRLAANWIGFISGRGDEGLRDVRARLDRPWSETIATLQRLLAAGPDRARPLLGGLGVPAAATDEWLGLLFPPPGRPVYVWVDFDKIKTPWFYYGTWDFERLEGTRFLFSPFANLRATPTRVIGPGLDIDLQLGRASYAGQLYRLARIEAKGGTRIYGDQGLIFDLDESVGFGVLMDDGVQSSVGRKLFVDRGVDPRYFRLAHARYPLHHLWEVRSESFTP